MNLRKRGILALMLGCMAALSGCSASYVDEGKDALDPMGYAAAGYYGKSQEELKELLPGLEYGGEPCMVLESQISGTVSCKQVFYFYEDELVQIDYEYLFDVGEDAERKFVEMCRRMYEIDPNVDNYAMYHGEFPVSLDRFLNSFNSPLGGDGLFWKEIIQSYPYLPCTTYFSTFCNEEVVRELNRGAEPEGWKNEYDITISGSFYHWYVDWQKIDGRHCTDEDMERSNASFLGGKEAQILLRIATWD